MGITLKSIFVVSTRSSCGVMEITLASPDDTSSESWATCFSSMFGLEAFAKSAIAEESEIEE